jgi:hypothetical protein
MLGRAVLAYGPIGHQIVGAVADEKLANKPAGAKGRASSARNFTKRGWRLADL